MRTLPLAAVVLLAGVVQASELTPESLESMRSTHLLFWSPEQQRVGYKNIRSIFPTRTVARGDRVWPLPDAHRDLSGFRYEFAGESLSLDDYMARMQTAGLIIVKDGEAVLERYTNGNDRDSRWVSFSVTKSVVSLLIGAAIKDGKISASHDIVSRYEPALTGGSYDGVSIRNLLQMSSGVAWNEDYSDPESDVSRTAVTTSAGNHSFLAFMAELPRAHSPGKEWNYNTGETIVAGSVLSAAVESNLSDYLSEKIWRAFGMESDADWLLMRPDDLEYGGCCISATLRDYARIGLFALNNGQTLGGGEVLPAGWIGESTQPADTQPGYGYFWWLGRDGSFSASGVFGQRIYIHPEHDLVIAMNSFWPRASGREFFEHRNAFLTAMTLNLAGSSEPASP